MKIPLSLHPDAALIDALGGTTHLARALGMNPQGGRQRINYWRIRGVPAAVKLEFPHVFLRDFKVDKRKKITPPKAKK
jgi:hypothetical protein